MLRTTGSLPHWESFEDAVNTINTAVKTSMTAEKYTTVAVLAMRWENDDLGLDAITMELLATFRDLYRFQTESLIIPAGSTREAVKAVQNRLRAFLARYDSPTSLLIIVYEGHSGYYRTSSLTTGEILHLFGAMTAGAVKISWEMVCNELLADGHVISIMDCCFATAAAISPNPGDIEYLVASSFESQASARIATSLTRRLIDLIRSLASPEISLLQLHARLVSQANKPESLLEYTPVYIASKKGVPTGLCPLSVLSAHDTPRTSNDLSEGKVLISVLLYGKATIPDIKEWERWLSTAIPEQVADIRLEAVFGSNSNLCLLTVPITTWSILQTNKAFSFIAYVESNNILGGISRSYTLAEHHGNVTVLHGRSKGQDIPTSGGRA